jgi:hypothetical protein
MIEQSAIRSDGYPCDTGTSVWTLDAETTMKNKSHNTCVDVLVEIQRYGRAVPWLRSLVTGLSPRRPRFAPGSIHVGFVVDKVALGQVFLQVLQFSPVSLSLFKLISSGNAYYANVK